MIDRLLPKRMVLTFHGVGNPQRQIDAAEQRYWLDERTFAQAIADAATVKGIEITFDDGNASDVAIALPQLKKTGLTATFYVLAGRLDAQGSLGRNDLALLIAEGMTIGSHGADHVDWTRSSDEVMQRELYDARRQIEDAAGAKIDKLSVPFGAFDARTLRLAAAAGYTSVSTSSGGLAGAGAWLIPRNTVRTDLSAQTLIRRLNHRRAQVESALRNPLREWKFSSPY